MIHPNTETRLVNAQIGYGVFATRPIPRGTLVYVKDKLEIELDSRQYKKLDEAHRQIADKYSYIDDRGVRIISWDNAKYVNHKCDCNTISTGYGFEIALRDIEAGEEITDDYGLFNLEQPMQVDCGCRECRKVLTSQDLDLYYEQWDAQVKDALKAVNLVDQPLWPLLDEQEREALMRYVNSGDDYRSVRSLKYQGASLRTTRRKRQISRIA